MLFRCRGSSRATGNREAKPGRGTAGGHKKSEAIRGGPNTSGNPAGNDQTRTERRRTHKAHPKLHTNY